MLGLQWGMLSSSSAGAKQYSLPHLADRAQVRQLPVGRRRFDASTAPNDQAYAVESWGLIRDWIKAGVTAYSAWNMVLDTVGNGIDTTRVWPQNALLTVDTASKTLNVTPAYYVFRHLSQFVDAGRQGRRDQRRRRGRRSRTRTAASSPSCTTPARAKTMIVAAAGKKLQFAMPGQRMGHRRLAMTNAVDVPTKQRAARRIVDHDRGPLCDRVQHLGEAMSNKNLKKPLLLLMTVGFAAAAGCRLSPPKSMDQGEGGVCIEDPEFVVADGGVAAADSDAARVPIDNVVMPVSCTGATYPDVKLNYVEPYAPAPEMLTAVNMTVATMPLPDKVKQMQGTLYGDAFHTQFNDIQRSQNTTEFVAGGTATPPAA